jgi:hypothetical protein
MRARAFAALALFDRQPVNDVQRRRQLALVKEGRASDVTAELQRRRPRYGSACFQTLSQCGEFLFQGGTTSGRSCRMFSRGTLV